MHILSSVHSDHRTISQKISEFEWWRRFMGGGLQPVNATRQESSVGNWLDASYNSDHKFDEVEGSPIIRDQAKATGNSMRLQHGAFSNIPLVKGSGENGVASGESAVLEHVGY
uniref:Uncharacterized protein n=1 Tax=Bionectria ochroleuca TaxID=29856 RepID=A0A0B7JM84_BIOOC